MVRVEDIQDLLLNMLSNAERESKVVARVCSQCGERDPGADAGTEYTRLRLLLSDFMVMDDAADAAQAIIDAGWENVQVADSTPCSQCGKRPSAMIKLGTADGWCEPCLVQAIEPDWFYKIDTWLENEHHDARCDSRRRVPGPPRDCTCWQAALREVMGDHRRADGECGGEPPCGVMLCGESVGHLPHHWQDEPRWYECTGERFAL